MSNDQPTTGTMLGAASAAIPGAGLLSITALASAALVVANDLWLKRHHPGAWSGKLSDVGLCVFLPLFLAALIECVIAVGRLVRARLAAGPVSSRAVDHVACGVTVVYFAMIKTIPGATQLHVEMLSRVTAHWHFRAVTDPTDLLCLPAMVLAVLAMKRRRSAARPSDVQRQRAIAPTMAPRSTGRGDLVPADRR